MVRVLKVVVVFLYLGLLNLPGFAQGNTDTKVMTLSVFVEPNLCLSIEGRDLSFDVKGLRETESIQRTSIEVATNLEVPYRVFLRPSGPLTNEQGRALPVEYLKFEVAGSIKGRSGIPTPQPLPTSEVLIYTSSPNGESDTITLIFYFQTQRMIPAGRYTTSITYRASTE